MARWIPYEAELGEGMAVVRIDIALIDEQADLGRGTRLVASMPLPDGAMRAAPAAQLATELDDSLNQVLASISGVLSESCDAVLAATVRGDDRLDAVFYLPGPNVEQAEGMLGVAMGPLGVEFEAEEDESWQLYHELLPEEGAIRRATNLEQIQKLAAAGDELGRSRLISHQLLLPGKAASVHAKADLLAKGFTVVGETIDADADLPVTLVVQRAESAEPESLLETCEELFAVADGLDGDYAGWECKPAQ